MSSRKSTGVAEAKGSFVTLHAEAGRDKGVASVEATGAGVSGCRDTLRFLSQVLWLHAEMLEPLDEVFVLQTGLPRRQRPAAWLTTREEGEPPSLSTDSEPPGEASAGLEWVTWPPAAVGGGAVIGGWLSPQKGGPLFWPEDS